MGRSPLRKGISYPRAMRPPGTLPLCVLVTVVLAGVPAPASVSNQEAMELKARLTPVGAERAGNADGTIPAWTGGITSAPGYVSGAPRPDPFAADNIGTNCLRCGYLVQPARERRGLLTCATCG